MYCSRCKYFSFDHLSSCPKCGQNWNTERKKLGLDWIIQTEQSWIAASKQIEKEGPADLLNQEDSSAPRFTFEKEDTDGPSREDKPGSSEIEPNNLDTVNHPPEQSEAKTDLPAAESSRQDLYKEIEYPDLEFIEDESDHEQKS